YFYVVIDNGTGSTCSDALLNAVSDNVDIYRGLTIQYNVDKATFIPITIDVWIELVPVPNQTDTEIIASVVSALQAYAASIPFNQPFLYSKIPEIVYLSNANIMSMPSSNPPQLNGSNVDIAGTNL